MSDVSLKQAQQRVRRLRNTMRFCLQNLSDFCPGAGPLAHHLAHDALQSACLRQMQSLQAELRGLAERYEFAALLAQLTLFCETLSSEYFPAWKDTLYCEPAHSETRRLVQTVLWRVAKFLLRALTPLTPFAAEDAAMALGTLVGEGRDGREDSAVLLTWSGCDAAQTQGPGPAMSGLQELRGALHRRLEAHRDGRELWEGMQGVKQLGRLRVVMGRSHLPQEWPADEAGLGLLAQYLGCARVELCDEPGPWRAYPEQAMACACCRRHCLPLGAMSSLCERCEQAQS